MFLRRIHELDLILYLANKAIPDKNGVLDILNLMARPRNTCSQARDYFYEIKDSYNYEMGMRGTVRCRPTLAYRMNFDGINVSDLTDYNIFLQREIGPMLF